MHFNAHQNVNSGLSIALISLMCFWVVLFYFKSKTEIVANAALAHQSSYFSFLEE